MRRGERLPKRFVPRPLVVRHHFIRRDVLTGLSTPFCIDHVDTVALSVFRRRAETTPYSFRRPLSTIHSFDVSFIFVIFRSPETRLCARYGRYTFTAHHLRHGDERSSLCLHMMLRDANFNDVCDETNNNSFCARNESTFWFPKINANYEKQTLQRNDVRF